MAPTSLAKWQQSTITLFEAISNFFVYVFALFIIIVPPLKWLNDAIPSTKLSGWGVLAALIALIVFLELMDKFMDLSFRIMEKFRDGSLLPVIVKPFKAICAVLTMYGLMRLEYKTIHSTTDKTVLDVYWRLLQSL